jgi:hypothetical protein
MKSLSRLWGRPPGLPYIAALAVLAAALASAAAPANIADLKREFEKPPDDARIMMRWWWFGPAANKPELERELRAMKEGGIGGFEVQPVYPLELEGNYPYLSPEFLDNLAFVGQKARELGLRFDLTLGSGWPFGGPQTPITLAAGRLRVDRVVIPANAASLPMPTIRDGEKFIAAFLGGNRLEVAGDAVRLPSGSGGIVLFFISSRTRQTVKRPSVGAEGWVLDHYDLNAIQNHLEKVGEPMLKAVSKTPPYAIFSDSLEVYNSDWTPDFLDEFRKRRGYDLTPYLPALAGDFGDKTAAIRHDWGQTLSELCDDRYLAPMTRWAEQHGTLFRSQTYGIPPVTLSSGSLVNLSEGEGTQWRRFSTTRWATSTSHLYGRNVTSSETWTWLHSPVFRATPLDMKAEADLHFIQGINQLVGHGWPYSPPEAGEPGWRFYAAAVFNNHNPWWMVMPDVTLYLQRISYLMRQGKPANDVALYLPTHDAFAGFTLGRDSVNQAIDGLIGGTVIPQILDAGYNFDFIDDGAIAKGGVPHKILILPNVERMPVATLEKVREYAAKGGKVIATRRLPSLAPGLRDENDTPKVRELARTLPLVTDESKLGAELHKLLPADLAAAPAIGFIHRKLDFADVYFLANTSNRPVKTPAVFRVQGLEAASWDPMTGQFAGLGPKIELDLAPFESRVIVFSKDRLPAARRAPAGPAPAPVDVSTGWTVTFPGAQPAKLDTLHSWADDEARKFYSGQATYEKTITVPNARGREIYLNFGAGTPVAVDDRRSGSGMRAMFENAVREAAVVYVNGKRAGSVWTAPYEVRITGFVRPGENTIRVVVANTAVNLLAKGPLPDYKALTAKYGERFQAQDMQAVQPLPSGLVGPVRLIVR